MVNYANAAHSSAKVEKLKMMHAFPGGPSKLSWENRATAADGLSLQDWLSKTIRQGLLGAESKKSPMNSQQLAFGLVIAETRLLESLHEKANARPRGPYHFCQRLMINLRNHSLG